MDIVLLFGEQGSGKTTAALRCAQKAWQANWRVSGIVAPGEFAENRRSAFTIIDLATGDSMPLAQRNYPSAVRAGSFGFYDAGLKLGHAALARARENSTDLAVIDEIGPMELHGGGWAEDVHNIIARGVPHLLVTVRPSIIAQVAAVFFPQAAHVLVHAKEYKKIFYHWNLNATVWQTR
jgi:nucleoside-triphosphatase THEP1